MDDTSPIINTYVTMGATDDLSVTMDKSSFDTGFIFFTLLFGIGFITVIIIIIVLSYNITKPKPIPKVVTVNSEPLTLNSNYGASPYANFKTNKFIKAPDDGSSFKSLKSCLSSSNTFWDKNTCNCASPFFGPSCNLEKHNSKYFAVGVPDVNNLEFNIIGTIRSDGKSFNNNNNINSCSNNCDVTPNCSSFIYNNGTCNLLSGNVTVPTDHTIPYSFDKDSTLYMKNPDDLHFNDKIFLGKFSWSFPSRFWLFDRTDSFIKLVPGKIYDIDFIPQHIKVNGSFIGIYCPFSFSLSDIPDIMSQSINSSCYIHLSNTPLMIPDYFYNRTYFVTYIPN